MIEHFERQPVYFMPPVSDTWISRMLGFFKPAYPCQSHFVEADEIITKPEGTDD